MCKGKWIVNSKVSPEEEYVEIGCVREDNALGIRSCGYDDGFNKITMFDDYCEVKDSIEQANEMAQVVCDALNKHEGEHSMDTITIKVNDLKDVSDGYHTISELYDHRCVLFILLALSNKEISCYKMDDNAPGWVILYIESPYGQISYHIPNRFMQMIDNANIPLKQDHQWDGHNSQDALKRLTDWGWSIGA